jgi:hypothetical protein
MLFSNCGCIVVEFISSVSGAGTENSFVERGQGGLREVTKTQNAIVLGRAARFSEFQ